jgi:hypothetical protein
MGAEAYVVLCNKVLPKKPMDEEITYDEVVKVLKSIVRSLKIYEAHRFHNMTQGESEGISDFILRLRQQERCDFEQYLDNVIRNQLVLGIRDITIQQKLLEVEDGKLEKVIQVAETMETIVKGKEYMKTNEVNFVDKKGQKKHYFESNRTFNKKPEKDAKGTKCYRCGNSSHLANVC